MKKTFKTLVFAIVGLLALASCEDVPAPYSVPDKNSNTISPADEIFSQSFTSSLGDFASLSESGSLTWSSSSKYGAIISGYDDWDGTGQKSNKPGVTYLISPEIDLSGTDNAYIIVEQAINYAKSTLTDDHHLLIRLAGTEVWTELPMVFNGLGSSFDYKTQNIQLPQSFVGQKVQVALKHIAHDSYSSTWEVKSIKVAKGLVPTDDGGGSGGDGGGGSTPSTSSKDKPLTVSQAKSASGNNYVKGYIVGYVDGQKLEGGATFGVPANAETEILLAETPDETSTDNVIPVQLPVGDIRSALELSAHPDYLKKEVLLYGSLETYFGVPGMKETSWASIDGKTYGKDPEGGSDDTPIGEAKGSGTESDPYNAIAAIQYAKSLGADVESGSDIYVTGVISSIKFTYSSSYGTATYNISVDGKAENEFTVYGSYYLNNQPWKDGDTQIEKGDVVVVCGKVVNYRGNTPEFVNKKNWLVSINKSGDGGDTPEPPTPGPGGDVVTDLVNGDFESWVSDTEPTGWKSASTASNATLSQSTDARTGSYACKVMAPGTQNKRLATQEITLAAGSYTFSFYAKSTTGNVCQSRAGYVPVTSGSVGAYKYGNYTNISNSEWTLVTYDFDLNEETTLCLVVMNPKDSDYSKSQDILVDDATLVKKQ